MAQIPLNTTLVFLPILCSNSSYQIIITMLFTLMSPHPLPQVPVMIKMHWQVPFQLYPFMKSFWFIRDSKYHSHLLEIKPHLNRKIEDVVTSPATGEHLLKTLIGLLEGSKTSILRVFLFPTPVIRYMNSSGEWIFL